MTWYEDLSPCDYFPAPTARQFLRAVGWLDCGHQYRTGSAPREVFIRLKSLLAKPWQPIVCLGGHSCELCRLESEATGHKNLFVPGDGILYVCPELILHYMIAHHYCPPDEFCQAVLRCPDCDSMEYRKLVLRNGASTLLHPERNR